MFGLKEWVIYLPLAVLVWLPIGLYCYSLYSNSYWKRNKIPYIPATPIVGNLLDMFLFRKCVAEILVDFYVDRKATDKPFVGIHFFHKPALLIRDPELIKQLLVKDFPSFCDRHTSSDMHSDLLGSSTLFLIPNPAWKIIRSRMTPFFTGGKLKQMFHLMQTIGNEMNEMLLAFEVNEESKSFPLEIKEIFGRYTTDVIASCAFGIDVNSLKYPENEFRRNGKRIFEVNWYRAFEFLSIFFIPEIVSFFKFKVFSKETTIFFRNSINKIMVEREESGSVRHDLIDTLIYLKNEDKSKHLSVENVVFQGDVIVAQAALFFTAAFETSSTLMTFAIYELALQPDLQTRLRREIKEALLASNGELTYDGVNDMVYLNMVIQEALRLYPPLSMLDRRCTKRDGYSLEPYDNFVIPCNMPIMVPLLAIHRDPKYWPNPNKFDPERFSAENKDKIIPYTYLPMGTGPHNCIGERFGLLQSKIGLINFLKNHYFTPTENTPRVIHLEPKAIVLHSKDPIVLNIVRDPLI